MQILIIKLLLRFFALLPLPLNHKLGSLVGLLIFLLPTRARKVTLTNLSLCFPDMPEKERKQLAKKSLKETGKSLTEMGPFWLWNKKRLCRLIRQVSGLEVLQQAVQKDKGILFLTPHLGAWEITTLYYSGKHPLTCLYRPPKIQALEPLIRNARERFGVKLEPINAQGIRSIYRALARKETVGILPDQDPGKNAGIFAPFLGVEANTMVLASRMVQKTGAQVIFVFAERLAHGKGYHLHFLEGPAEIYDEQIEVSATAMNRGVETCIAMKPEQYQWSYKRFKTRQEGAPDPYRN
jgi:KDO2-lipid IV(A) lauroyltransferase